jgi:hypothetical protein
MMHVGDGLEATQEGRRRYLVCQHDFGQGIGDDAAAGEY